MRLRLLSTAKKSSSSRRWLSRQKNDPYTIKAQKEGYRSRAAYKLLEINEKDHLLVEGQIIVDLGGAPGGWSQVAKKMVGLDGMVFALDILPIEPIPGVDIITGDFTEQTSYAELVGKLDGKPVNVVLSDMSPNLSGISDIDIPRAIYLGEIALDFAKEVLVKDGCFLVKLFQGSGFVEYQRLLRENFETVVTRKPKASRDESKEVYLLAKNFRSLKD